MTWLKPAEKSILNKSAIYCGSSVKLQLPPQILPKVSTICCQLNQHYVVLGTAIGLQLLFGLPLIIGVTLTVFDTLLFLVVQRFGIRKLEAFVFGLLAVVTLCFVVELFLCKPNAGDLFQGFIPRINSQSLYDALGMLGVYIYILYYVFFNISCLGYCNAT